MADRNIETIKNNPPNAIKSASELGAASVDKGQSRDQSVSKAGAGGCDKGKKCSQTIFIDFLKSDMKQLDNVPDILFFPNLVHCDFRKTTQQSQVTLKVNLRRICAPRIDKEGAVL